MSEASVIYFVTSHLSYVLVTLMGISKRTDTTPEVHSLFLLAAVTIHLSQSAVEPQEKEVTEMPWSPSRFMYRFTA